MSKEIFVNTLQVGEEIVGFFMIKLIGVKTGSNNKQYLDLILGDSTGEISGKKWDVSDDEALRLANIFVGDLVKIKAKVTEWNGTKQLTVTRIRELRADEKFPMADFVSAAPEDSEEMYDYIYEKALSIGDEGLRSMALLFLDSEKKRLRYYPAAMRNHHAQYGGLLYHMKRMLMMGEKACEIYPVLDKDWMICGVILHDMEKLNEILSNEYGVSPGYSAKGKLLGHISQGVVKISQMAEEVGLDEERTMMLQHMILSHHYEPEYGSPVKPMFPEAEMLHYLDMIDAKLFDYEEALAGVEPGNFSEPVFTLDRRMLYKPSFADE
ncbi:MAG: HD domain-containing protein [Clostridiales bacterium]|nr:HD domain-containing protein [Clostridiales bacterium]